MAFTCMATALEGYGKCFGHAGLGWTRPSSKKPQPLGGNHMRPEMLARFKELLRKDDPVEAAGELAAFMLVKVEELQLAGAAEELQSAVARVAQQALKTWADIRAMERGPGGSSPTGDGAPEGSEDDELLIAYFTDDGTPDGQVAADGKGDGAPAVGEDSRGASDTLPPRDTGGGGSSTPSG